MELETRRSEEELLLEPVIWSVAFADGRIRSVRHSGWDAFSHIADIDGVPLHVSNDPIETIMVTRAKSSYLLKVEEPACCFAFHRWRSRLLVSSASWHYSVFGYIRGDDRVLLQVTETMGRMMIQKRTRPFDLLALGRQ